MKKIITWGLSASLLCGGLAFAQDTGNTDVGTANNTLDPSTAPAGMTNKRKSTKKHDKKAMHKKHRKGHKGATKTESSDPLPTGTGAEADAGKM